MRGPYTPSDQKLAGKQQPCMPGINAAGLQPIRTQKQLGDGHCQLTAAWPAGCIQTA